MAIPRNLLWQNQGFLLDRIQETEKPLSIRSRIRKALICLARATRKETENLKREMVGKAIGALALLGSDMEQTYEEAKITDR